jgi:threonine/homoserine/homoserine lactone efflux protein
MDFLLDFFASTLMVILVVLTPGPSTTLVIKNSILKSRNDGIATALGIALGNTFYVSIGLLGAAALIVGSKEIFTIIRYFGAAYLAYLGLRLLLSKKKQLITIGNHIRTGFWLSFREGLLTNLSNPKYLLLLLAFFAQFITSETPLYFQALMAYQFPVIAFMWFAILSVLLTIQLIRDRISPFLYYVEKVTGIVLIAFAFLAVFGA